MTHPIECHDEFGLEGVKDAQDFIKWFNSWLQDQDSAECTIKKIGPLDPSNYIIQSPQKQPVNLPGESVEDVKAAGRPVATGASLPPFLKLPKG